MIRICQTLLAALLLSFAGTVLAVGEGDQVNINTADATTLAEVLDGVGASRADAIVQYREEHGNFMDIYELANVKGIGERTVEPNAEKIVLED